MRSERFHQFDQPYIDRLAACDPDTEAHFTQYFGELLSIKLRARLRSPALVDDVRQETFVRVLDAVRQPNGIRSPGGFGSFANTVCNHVLLEMYRARPRTDALEDAAGDGIPDPRDDAEASAVRDEQRSHVRRAIAELPPREQQLLAMLFFHERDKDGICRQLGIDRQYLRVLLYRAKRRFKEQYVGL